MKRVFIGIPVDKPARGAIGRLLEPIRIVSDTIRWVPESNWHLTLAFLGNMPVSAVEHLLQSAPAAYRHHERFQYRLSALSRFPGPTGRIIALLGDPVRPLQQLFRTTLELLRDNRTEFDQKAFRPHVTLARIRKPRQVEARFRQAANVQLNVSKVVVYQSKMSNSGSVYSSLGEIQLN